MGPRSSRLSLSHPFRAHAIRPDSVLLASGFHEGVDLKDDLAGFGMIAKVPHLVRIVE